MQKRREERRRARSWPTTRLDMVSWNLAGIPAGELDTFVGHVSLHMMWDVMTIQEGFRKQEGLNSGGHELYTAPQLTKGNLRCPAILIHQRWAGQSTYLDGGTRWLAVSLWETATILSIHLPHSGCKISDFQDTLSEVHGFLEKRPKGALLLGMDCNVSLAGVVDRDLIGEAVMERPGRILSVQEKERQALLVEFMEEHSLMACNAWQNTEHPELMCTRQAWSDGQKAQIDFIMASQDWYLQDTWIDQYTHAATDHRPVCAELTKRILCGYKPKFTKKPRSLLNWQPGDNWTEKAKETLKEDGLENWREWTERVRGIAQENRKDTTRRKDPLLLSLMAQFKAFSDTSPEERKFLSKQIWRRKRHLKREAIEQTIQTAAAAGRAPPGPRPSLHVRWDKLLEGKESSPEELLSDYFTKSSTALKRRKLSNEMLRYSPMKTWLCSSTWEADGSRSSSRVDVVKVKKELMGSQIWVRESKRESERESERKMESKSIFVFFCYDNLRDLPQIVMFIVCCLTSIDHELLKLSEKQMGMKKGRTLDDHCPHETLRMSHGQRLCFATTAQSSP